MSISSTIVCRFLRSVINKIRKVNYKGAYYLRKANIARQTITVAEDKIEQVLQWSEREILHAEMSNYMQF